MQFALEQPQLVTHESHDRSRSGYNRRPRPAQKLRNRHIQPRKSVTEILVQALGREATSTIVSALGGTRIWVPLRTQTEERLAELIGGEAAAGLCAHFGGDYLQIPNTLPDMSLPQRIAELHRQGRKINEIALAVGRSRRTVFRLLRTKITVLQRPGGFARQTTLRSTNEMQG